VTPPADAETVTVVGTETLCVRIGTATVLVLTPTVTEPTMEIAWWLELVIDTGNPPAGATAESVTLPAVSCPMLEVSPPMANPLRTGVAGVGAGAGGAGATGVGAAGLLSPPPPHAAAPTTPTRTLSHIETSR
jgi:hypothetical protein